MAPLRFMPVIVKSPVSGICSDSLFPAFHRCMPAAVLSNTSPSLDKPAGKTPGAKTVRAELDVLTSGRSAAAPAILDAVEPTEVAASADVSPVDCPDEATNPNQQLVTSTWTHFLASDDKNRLMAGAWAGARDKPGPTRWRRPAP